MNKQTFELEIKSVDDASGEFEGYAAVFGNEDLGGDVIEHGAFTKTLQERPNIPILWQHDPDNPIGKSIIVSETEHGLAVKGQLNLDVQQGREAYALVKQGALSGLSIGFQTVKDKWNEGVRHLKEVKLFEYSLVTFPMNPLANITAIKSKRDIESKVNCLIEKYEDDDEKLKYILDALNTLSEAEPVSATPAEDKPCLQIDGLINELKALNETMRSN